MRRFSVLTVAGMVVVGATVTAAGFSETSQVSALLAPGLEFSVDAEVAADSYLIGNVTAISKSAGGGWAAVFGGTFQGSSTVNTYGNGDVLPNAFIADPGADGEIGVKVGGSSQREIVVDSVAELAKNPFTTIFASPKRIKDTRKSGVTVVAGGTTRVDVGKQYAGRFAIINLTVDGNTSPGWQATYPCADGYKGTSSINVKGTGGAQAILNVVKVDANGEICVRSLKSAAGTIIDFLGTVKSDADPFTRRVDTRTGSGRLQPGVERSFVVGDPNSVFVGTVVSTNPSAKGWVAAYTDAGGYKGTSTLNSNGVNSIANLVIMKTDNNGAIQLLSKGSANGRAGLATDIVIDGTMMPELQPYLNAKSKRLADSRDGLPGGSQNDGQFSFLSQSGPNPLSLANFKGSCDAYNGGSGGTGANYYVAIDGLQPDTNPTAASNGEIVHIRYTSYDDFGKPYEVSHQAVANEDGKVYTTGNRDSDTTFTSIAIQDLEVIRSVGKPITQQTRMVLTALITCKF